MIFLFSFFFIFSAFADQTINLSHKAESDFYYSEVDISLDEYEKLIYIHGLGQKEALKRVMAPDTTYAKQVIEQKLIDQLKRQVVPPYFEKRKLIKVDVLKISNHFHLRTDGKNKKFFLSYYTAKAKVALVTNFEIQMESKNKNNRIFEYQLSLSDGNTLLKRIVSDGQGIFPNLKGKYTYEIFRFGEREQGILVDFLKDYMHARIFPHLKIEFALKSKKLPYIIDLELDQLYEILKIKKPSISRRIFAKCFKHFLPFY